MDELISRQDAIDEIMGQPPEPHYPSWYAEQIKGLPTAQPDLCDGCDRYGASCVGEGCGKLEMSEVAKDTNVPINDCISRQDAIDVLDNIKIPRNASWYPYYQQALTAMSRLPSAQPEIKPIDYQDCANAMMRMWMDNVVTDGEYNRIMDKLNAFWRTRNERFDRQTGGD